MKTFKKTLKKVFFAVIALCISIGCIFQDNNTVLQAAVLYYPRTTAPDRSDYHYYSDNPFYQSNYGMPNCTAYAWGRAYEILGYKPNLSRNNANKWFNYNVNNGAFNYGYTPKIGSIICWNGGSGHVAVVEAVSGDRMTISESSWGGFNFRTKTDYIGNIQAANPGFQGYIYLGDYTIETIPVTPNLSLTNSGYNYTMSWNDVGANEYIVRIYCADEEVKVINVGRNFSYTIPLIGKNYWAAVSAKNSAGESPISNCVEMLPSGYNLLGKAQNLGQHFYAQIGFSNNTYLLNVNNNAQLGKLSSSNKAIYEFTRTSYESYTIKDVKTGLYLDVTGAATKSGTNMQFYKNNPGPAQRFFIRKFNNGYSLQPECAPYLTLNAYGANFNSGTNIQLYGIDLTAAHKLYIRKGGIKIPAKAKGYTGTYDGKTHTISISNVPSGSTIYYRTSTKANWTTKKPVRKSAGTTTVYYKISNNRYSQTFSGSAKISIKKASQKGYAKSYNGSYTGKAHTITLSSVASGSKVYYRTSTKAKWSTKKPTRTSIGTTKVYYKIVNSNCTSTKYGTAQITNKKAVQKAKAKNYNGNYNGKAHTIGFSNVVTGSKAYYRTSTKSKWTTKKPTRTSIGTTKVYYKIVNRNCTKTVYGSTYIKVNKGVQKPVVKSYYGNYDAKSHTISITKIAKNSTVYYRTSSKGKWTRTKPYRKSVGITTVYYKITNKNYTTKYGTTKISIQRKVTGIKLNNTLVTLYTPNTYQLKATITPSNATNKKVTWTSSNPKVATVSSSGKVTAKAAGTTKITAKASSGKTVTCTIRVNQKNVYISDGAYALVSPNQQFALTTPGTANFSKLNMQAYGGYNTQIWNLNNLGGNAFVLRSQLDYNKVVDIYHINTGYITAASQYDTPPTYYGNVEGHAYLNPYTDPMADEWRATKLYNGTYIITLKQYPDFKLTRGGDYDANGNSVYLYHWNAWQQTYWKLIKLQ